MCGDAQAFNGFSSWSRPGVSGAGRRSCANRDAAAQVHASPRTPPSERGRATAVRFFLKMARQHSHLCEMQMHQTLPWAPLLSGDHSRSLAGFEPSVTCALFALHLSAALANSWSPTTALAQDSLHALSPSGRAQSLLLVLGGDTVPGLCLKWLLSDCTITAALASFSR